MEGAAHVIAVERDVRCLPALAEIAAAYPGRLEIVSDDALKIGESELLRTRSVSVGPVRVAANLPYNVGTALLVKWLTAENWPPFWESLTLMFQREVAERLVGRAGHKGVWTALRACPMARDTAHPVRRGRARVHAAARGSHPHSSGWSRWRSPSRQCAFAIWKR